MLRNVWVTSVFTPERYRGGLRCRPWEMRDGRCWVVQSRELLLQLGFHLLIGEIAGHREHDVCREEVALVKACEIVARDAVQRGFHLPAVGRVPAVNESVNSRSAMPAARRCAARCRYAAAYLTRSIFVLAELGRGQHICEREPSPHRYFPSGRKGHRPECLTEFAFYATPRCSPTLHRSIAGLGSRAAGAHTSPVTVARPTLSAGSNRFPVRTSAAPATRAAHDPPADTRSCRWAGCKSPLGDLNRTQRWDTSDPYMTGLWSPARRASAVPDHGPPRGSPASGAQKRRRRAVWHWAESRESGWAPGFHGNGRECEERNRLAVVLIELLIGTGSCWPRAHWIRYRPPCGWRGRNTSMPRAGHHPPSPCSIHRAK